MEFNDIIYQKKDGVAQITINRPDKLNAATQQTMHEISQALSDAWVDSDVGVVVLTGIGDRAFCTGGDQSVRDVGGYSGTTAMLPLEVLWQQVTQLIRTIPKPVIARVNGYAIGGGHVLQVACDLSIASETGCVGMKKAKEIWYLCRRYTAQESLDMGLINCVVPAEKLDEEVDKWCQELLTKSPTALKMLKYAFHAEWDGIVGITNLGVGGLSLYYGTEEAVEGRNAFMEKRQPDFGKFRK